MKTVVYNFKQQYALSRAEIETIQRVMPKSAWSTIREFHLAHSHPSACERFEFDMHSGIAYLIVPVSQKNAALRTEALRELLTGLPRIQTKSRFFHPLAALERAEHQAFVEKWSAVCEAAMARLHGND